MKKWLLCSAVAVAATACGVPTLVARDVSRQFRVRVVGRIREVRERFYAVTVERKGKHPPVLALCQDARQRLNRAAE